MLRNQLRRALLVSTMALLMTTVAASGAWAEEPAAPEEDDSGQVYDTGDTVVTGTRTKRRLSDTPVMTELIRPERIEAKGATSLIEALAYEPGIRIDNVCSICNTTGIKLGGLPGRYTLVLIDGMPVYSSLGATYGLLNIAAPDIAQIEIVKGAASVLYGSDAIGGVVNVITRRPGREPRASLSVEAGDFGYARILGSASMRKGPLGLSLVGSFTNHDAIDRDGDEVSEYTGYRRAYFAGTATWDINDDMSLLARLSYSQEQRQGGGLGSFLQVVDDDDERRAFSESILTRRFEGGLRYDWAISDALHLDVTSQVTWHDQDSDYEGEIYVGKQLMLYEQVALTAKLHERYDLLGGLTYRYENLDENLALSEYTYHLPGVFVQGDWRIADWVEFVHGARLDYHNEYGLAVSPRAVLKFAPHEHLTIRAASGMGFRAPTTFYEYAHGVRPDGYGLHNDADKPERSVNASLGVTWDMGRVFSATVAGHYNLVMDPITLDTSEDDSGIGSIHVYNAPGELQVLGLEVQAQSRPVSWLRPSLGYSFNHYDDSAGTLVSAAPEHQITAGLDFLVDSIGFTASINAEIYGPMDLERVYGSAYNPCKGCSLPDLLDTANADTASLKRTTSPWYGVLNVRVQQRLFDHLSVYLGVDNLLDYHQADHESPLFYPNEGGTAGPADVVHIWGPMRGRFVYGGLRLDI